MLGGCVSLSFVFVGWLVLVLHCFGFEFRGFRLFAAFQGDGGPEPVGLYNHILSPVLCGSQ